MTPLYLKGKIAAKEKNTGSAKADSVLMLVPFPITIKDYC